MGRIFAHRFVCITDVVHGHVPMQDSSSAELLDFGDHDFPVCKSCKPEQFQAFHPDSWDSFIVLSTSILARVSLIKAKILNYGNKGWYILFPFVLSHPFSHLACIQATTTATSLAAAIKILESLPSLRYLYAPLPRFTEFSLKASTLTNLNLSFSLPNLSSTLTDKEPYLPALRHLNIEGLMLYSAGKVRQACLVSIREDCRHGITFPVFAPGTKMYK
jgi:hypothetical protein